MSGTKEGNSVEVPDEGNAGSCNHRCIVCLHTFQSKAALVDHVQTQHKPPPYRCHVCRYGFTRGSELTDHLRTHLGYITKGDTLLCVTCGERCADDASLKDHRKVHTDDETPMCRICDEPYDHLIRVHTGPKPFKCRICLKLFKKSSDFHMHVTTHSGDSLYTCDVCGKGFSRKTKIRNHRLLVHDIRSHKCSTCNLTFDDAEYESHRQSHGSSVFNECNVCNKVFDSVSTFERHKMFHGRTPCFVCKTCNKRFHVLAQLLSHVATHSKSRQYECEVCDVQFSTIEEFNNHRVRRHKQTPLVACLNCNAVFTSQIQLAEHRLEHYRACLPNTSNTNEHLSSHQERGSQSPNEDILTEHRTITIHPTNDDTCELTNHRLEDNDNTSELTNHRLQDNVNPSELTKDRLEDNYNPSELTNHRLEDTHDTSELTNHRLEDNDDTSELTTHRLEDNDNTYKLTNQEFECDVCSGRFANSHSFEIHRKLHTVEQIQNASSHNDVNLQRNTGGIALTAESSTGSNSNRTAISHTSPPSNSKDQIQNRNVASGPEKWLYKCGICFSTFISVEECSKHVLVHRANSTVTVKEDGEAPEALPQNRECELCRFCGKMFLTHYHQRLHRKRHKELEIKHTCDVCGKAFGNERSFVQHQCSEKSKQQTKCAICDDNFSSEALLDRHWTIHKGRTVKCEKCNAVFTRLSNLYRHESKFHLDRNLIRCTICPRLFTDKGGLDDHLRTHVKACTRCGVCNVRFDFPHLLEHHMEQKHKIGNVYKCSPCTQYFFSVLEYQAHQLTHVKSMYTCDICKMVFKNSSRLLQHNNTVHTVNKGTYYTCNWCGMRFMRPRNLRSHKKRRNCCRSRTFTCVICKEEFQRLDLLQNHTTKTHINKTEVPNSDIQITDELQLPQDHHTTPVVLADARGADQQKVGELQRMLEHHASSRVGLAGTRTKDKSDNDKDDEGAEVCSGEVSSVLGDYEQEQEVEENIYNDVICLENGTGDDDAADDHCASDSIQENDKPLSSSVMFRCVVCNNKFPSPEDLKQHISQHDREERVHNQIHYLTTSTAQVSTYDNSIGGKDANVDSQICHNTQTVVSRSSLNLYKCGLCNHVFAKIVDLDDHILKHNENEKSYRCSVCDFTSHSVSVFQKHCASHDETSNGESAVTNGQRLSTTRLEHAKSGDRDKGIGHADCRISNGKDEEAERKLSKTIQHLAVVSKPPRTERMGIFDLLSSGGMCWGDIRSDEHSGDICNKTCNSLSEYNFHSKQHKYEKKTQVDISNEESTNCTSNLSDTVSVNLYHCGQCERSFCVSSGLVDHCKTHTPPNVRDKVSGIVKSDACTLAHSSTRMHNEAYKCSQCDKVFKTRSSLYSHCEIHITMPTIRLQRQVFMDNTPTESVPVSDLPDGVHTTQQNLQQAAMDVVNRNANSGNTPSASEAMETGHGSQCNTRYRCKVCDCKFTSLHGFRVHCGRSHKDCDPDTSKSIDIIMHESPESTSMDVQNRPAIRKPNMDNPSVVKARTDDNLVLEMFWCKFCDKVFSTKRGMTLHETLFHHKTLQDASTGVETSYSHRCKPRGKNFASAPLLRSHMLTHTPKELEPTFVKRNRLRDKGPKPYRCLLCDRVFGTLHGINIHSNYHTGKETTAHLPTDHLFQCLICSTPFHTVIQLRIHNEMAHKVGQDTTASEKKMDSSTNDNPSYTDSEMTGQEISKNSETENLVDTDSKIMLQGTSTDTLDTELSLDNSPPVDSGESTTSMDDQYGNVSRTAEMFSTETSSSNVCDRGFNSEGTLKKHSAIHAQSEKETQQVSIQTPDISAPDRQPWPYICSTCGRVFTSSAGLTVHRKYHTVMPGDVRKSFSVGTGSDVMSQGFSNPTTVSGKPIRAISPYDGDGSGGVCGVKKDVSINRCRKCPRAHTNYKTALIDMKIHKEKYVCEDCGEEFNDVWPYQSHRDTHKTMVKSHKCELCRKKFSTSSSMVRHMKAHTGKTLPYMCDVCETEFNTTEELGEHCQTHIEEDSKGEDEECDDTISMEHDSNHEDNNVSSVSRNELRGQENVASADSNTNSVVESAFPQKLTDENTDDVEEVQDEPGNGPVYHKCCLCDEAFTSLDGLNSHRRTHCDKSDQTSSPIVQTPVSVPSTSPDNEKSVRTPNMKTNDIVVNDEEIGGTKMVAEKRQYMCDICNRCFRSMDEISDHCRSHLETQPTFSNKRKRLEFFHSLNDNDRQCFKCNICDRDYKTVASIQRHYKTHQGDTVYICHVCDKTFHQPSVLREHILSHDRDAYHKCNVCGLRFTRIKLYRQHMSKHSEVTKNEHPSNACSLCCKTFLTRKDFETHQQECNKEKSFVCDICNRGFARLQTLKAHRRTHEDTKAYRCYVCGNRYTLSQNLRHHLEAAHNQSIAMETIENMSLNKKPRNDSMYMRLSPSKPSAQIKISDAIQLTKTSSDRIQASSVSTVEEMSQGDTQDVNKYNEPSSQTKQTWTREFKCSKCPKCFITPGALHRHSFVHANATYTCKICGNSTATQSGLRAHLNAHHPIKMSRCGVCRATFTNRSKLERHMKSHIKRESKCGICQKSFETNSKLMLHFRSHTSNSSVKCMECHKTFASRGHLTMHMRTHTGEQSTVNCSLCNHDFWNLSSLRRHMNTLHQGVNNVAQKCYYCRRLFFHNSELEKHIFNTHPNRAYMCETCDKQFIHTEDRDSHVCEHQAITSHRCRACSTSFLSEDSLRRHLAAVHPTQPYACTMCTIQFPSMSAKQRHLTAVHKHTATQVVPRKAPSNINNVSASDVQIQNTSSRPGQNNHVRFCRVCDMLFSSISAKQKHMVEEHGQKRYRLACSVCGLMFHHRCRLTVHMYTHTAYP